MRCFWRDTTGPHCRGHEGYNVSKKVTSTLVLHIESATEKHAGCYVCQVIPSDPDDLKSCNFKVKDGDQQAFMKTSVVSDVKTEATSLLVDIDQTTETENQTVYVPQLENTALYKVLVESDTQPKVDHKKEVFLACETGDVEKLKRVYRAEYLHSTNSDGETPLHVASRYGHENILNELLFRGADIHSEDNRKWTPLHTASFTGAFDAVKLLLQKGAQFEKKTKDGSTPLHLACRAETKHASIRFPSIHVLSDSSVEYTSVSADGTHVTTPSGSGTVSTTDQKPAEKGITRAEEINDDESTDRKGKEKRNISTNQHEAVVKRLLSVNCNVNARDGRKRTPLHVASSSGNAAILKLLLEAKANVEARDRVGRTPLHLASQTDEVSVVKQLLEAGADIDATEDNGRTPPQLARQAGKQQIVTFLVDHQRRTKTQQ
ncbi:hypothetical protein BaRGS_00013301 [Batillaria attramentaria]|uniref:Uncharacterized protein n=1 Tax=Batillaria attramentaria TaxID=370345 RepID=A0ABD0L7B2_9CAEN